MRKLLLALALAGFTLGCGTSTPFSPDDAGSLQPAEGCTEQDGRPC